MTPQAFAELLGVVGTTVYRWERRGDSEIPLDPHAARILRLIDERVVPLDSAPRATLVSRVSNGIQQHGGLVGLYRLLACVYERES